MIRKKAKKKTVTEKRNYAKKSLSNDVEKAMKRYLNDLNGHTPNKLHDIFLEEVEKVIKITAFLSKSYSNLQWEFQRKSQLLQLPPPLPRITF